VNIPVSQPRIESGVDANHDAYAARMQSADHVGAKFACPPGSQSGRRSQLLDGWWGRTEIHQRRRGDHATDGDVRLGDAVCKRI
jgi:hypothetical protein